MLAVSDVTMQDVITEFLTSLVTDFQAYLANNNRNATGESSASIQAANVTEDGGQVIGSSSIQWVFTGRGPGAMPPISKIIDWLNARGLPRSIAWAVAKKISEEGTKLFQQGGRTDNGLTQILTPYRIELFSKNISVLLATEIASDIQGVFA